VGKRLALIVATNRYEDHGLDELKAPSHDARALESVLSDESIGGFDVQTVIDGTVQELRIAVESLFADRDADDTVLLHFSCHGLKNEAGKLLLAARDTRLRLPAATSIPAEYISSLMLNTRALRSMLLLDCCYGGAFERGLVTRANADAQVLDSFREHEQSMSDRGRIVITASSALQYAFDGDRLVDDEQDQPSVFTGALVEALTTGDADRDGDGKIGASELFEYVRQRVASITPHQTPQMWSFGASGDIFVANSKTKALRPTPVPRDLQEAIQAPDTLRRIGAATALGYLVMGQDLPVALGAIEELTRLQDDDSRKVAQAAAASLATARPQTNRKTVNLPADGSPAAPLKMQGPPIALATIELGPSTSNLLAAVTAEGIELRLADPAIGFSQDTVAINTATGVLEVQVRRQPEAKPIDAETPPTNYLPRQEESRVENAGTRGLPDWMTRTEKQDRAEVPTFSVLGSQQGLQSWLAAYRRVTSRGAPNTRFIKKIPVAVLLAIVGVLQLMAPWFPYGSYADSLGGVATHSESVPWGVYLPIGVLSLWLAADLMRDGNARRRWWLLWLDIVLTWVGYGVLSNSDLVVKDGAGQGFVIFSIFIQWFLLFVIRRKPRPGNASAVEAEHATAIA
jgi:hypothetical protein